MKRLQPVRKSLSRQFGVSMAAFIIFFVAGSSLLLYFQDSLNTSFYEDRQQIVRMEKLSTDINSRFNRAFFDMRGYLAFDNRQLLQSAMKQKEEIDLKVRELKQAASTRRDKEMASGIRAFYKYYFIDTIPIVIKDVNEGHKERVVELAAKESTARVNSFQNELDDYQTDLDDRLESRMNELTKSQGILQRYFISFILIISVVVYFILKTMIQRVGQPLSQIAEAANEIALGRGASLAMNKREDELGILSSAFNKMVATLQDKEKDLVAQNEELSAQQDELQAQQDELQYTLDVLRDNEINLNRRNELINRISNSLDKQDVLDSIIKNMCQLIGADKGIITLLHEDSFSAYGVSKRGVAQFRANIFNGLNQKLLKDQESFMIKREQEPEEKGFHEGVLYSYDLYVPVISSLHAVTAIMVFSRLGSPFPESLQHEYKALAKQTGISLEKIALYQKSEEDRKLNQNIINSVQEGIQLLDTGGSIVQMNKQLGDRFFGGKTVSGLTFSDWSAIMNPYIAEFEEFIKFVKNAIECESRVHEENSLIYSLKDSNQVFKVYSENVFSGNEKAGTVLVHRDITNEFEIDRMKSEFVSTVSHELRTPLASVLGFTELMLTKELKPDRQKKYLATILSEAKRLTGLINDFLDVQRMESGKQSYERISTQLDEILEKVIEKHQVHAAGHTISLDLRDEREVVYADPEKLEQVFTNLIGNAVKYSPGGGRIEITVYRDGPFLKTSIKDEGLGIPEDSLGKLFQKFYRVDNTDRRKIGGTGLGLAIVQEIVKAHSGDITVESEFGKGSVFTVSLPLAYEEKRTAISSDGVKIMLIEDDRSLSELLMSELQEKGFSVEHFNRGEEAADALNIGEPPAALVLDIGLSGSSMDGWDIMKLVKADARLKNLPIFISSALEEKERGLSLGADEYLVKPYKLSMLSSTIKEALEKKEQQGEIHIPRKSS
ncbi:ATP-binding protein [Peribacillus sp. SCS-37]|uniref:ATP-binding protein n=1 Tax=Paraperibacillus esterisolvens TaxID=3115296 RepID=UPI003905DD37